MQWDSGSETGMKISFRGLWTTFVLEIKFGTELQLRDPRVPSYHRNSRNTKQQMKYINPLG